MPQDKGAMPMPEATTYELTSPIVKIRDRSQTKGIMEQPKKRGDRNYFQEQRLKGKCPKCRMIVPAIQTVDKHKDYALLKHYCKYCNKLLHIQRYPLAAASKFHDARTKRWI